MKQLAVSLFLLGSAAPQNNELPGGVAVTAWDVAVRLREQTPGRNL